jgi:hypothetical protein
LIVAVRRDFAIRTLFHHLWLADTIKVVVEANFRGKPVYIAEGKLGC